MIFRDNQWLIILWIVTLSFNHANMINITMLHGHLQLPSSEVMLIILRYSLHLLILIIIIVIIKKLAQPLGVVNRFKEFSRQVSAAMVVM